MPPPARQGSAAIKIVRPPADAVPASPSRGALATAPLASENGVGSEMGTPERGKRDPGTKMCRNIAIYGSCRFQDKGCIYNHPPPEDIASDFGPDPSTMKAPALAPTFVPRTRQTSSLEDTASDASGAALGQGHVAAPVFVPQFATGAEHPDAYAETQADMGYNGERIEPVGYDDAFLEHGHQSMEPNMYMPAPQARQELDYHLYVSPLPSLNRPPVQHDPLRSFFIPDDLRRTLSARSEASFSTAPSSSGLPAEVGVYHSLVPLDHVSGSSKAFTMPAPVYRATSGADGNLYVLRRMEGYKMVNQAAFNTIEQWQRIHNPNIVGLREAFTTRAFNDNSLIFVSDYYPNSTTLWDEHMNPKAPPLAMGLRRQGMPIPERLLWSYISQLASAIKAIQHAGLAVRFIDPSKILITGKNRLRLNACGIMDVLAYDGTPPERFQEQDLVLLGHLLFRLACEFWTPHTHPSMAWEHISRHYSADLKELLSYLTSPPSSNPHKHIDVVCQMVQMRLLNELDAAQTYNDVLESELQAEMENGRVARLMMKLGFINERAEYGRDPRWSETGDRYILKLFRDYVFHSVDPTGAPVMDLSHVLTCLNKLDAGVEEKVMLVSPDEQSCLVVSYKEIQNCVEQAYNELRRPPGTGMMGMPIGMGGMM